MNPSSMKKHLLMLHRLYFKTLDIYGERVNPREAEKVKELQGILQYVQTKRSLSLTLSEDNQQQDTESLAATFRSVCRFWKLFGQTHATSQS